MNRFFNFLPWGIIVALLGYYYFFGQTTPAETGAPISNQPVKDKVEPVKTYKDAQGNEHFLAKDDKNLITKDYLKNPDRPKNIVDSAALNLKIATAEIQRVTKIATAAEARELKALRQVDELSKKLSFAYSDDYVKLRYTPPADTDTVGAGTFDFGYNAELTITQYQKRKWFLGSKESFIDISSNDPRTTIRGVRQLTIKQETPQFGLRVQASANYNPQTGSIGLGPAVRIDLGRFSIQGNYTYYPESTRWRPGITGNYDLIRF